MNTNLKHLAIAVVAATLSGTAMAGEDKSHAGAMEKAAPEFSRLDTDQDGLVTQRELQNAGEDVRTEALKEKWSELDTNQDGALDRSEFARFEPARDKSAREKKGTTYHTGDEYKTGGDAGAEGGYDDEAIEGMNTQ